MLQLWDDVVPLLLGVDEPRLEIAPPVALVDLVKALAGIVVPLRHVFNRADLVVIVSSYWGVAVPLASTLSMTKVIPVSVGKPVTEDKGIV